MLTVRYFSIAVISITYKHNAHTYYTLFISG